MPALSAALVAAALAAAPLATAITLNPTPFRKVLDPAPAPASTPAYALDEVIGSSYLFYEAQRSGAIDSMPDGGNRIPWRGDQLLEDGSDVGLDLTGGYYEAGNRLKVTLATGYALSRLAWSCLYFHDVYASQTFDGQSLLYWCKREVKWGAYWLLKTHVPGAAGRLETWQDDDRFVMMVGTVQEPWGGPNPGDFDCYKRAENIPAEPNCPLSARPTLIGDIDNPAADGAGEASAALAAAAALLQSDYPMFADFAVRSSRALYDFASRFPEGATDREFIIGRTYPTTEPTLNVMYAAAMLAWTSNCDDAALASCDTALAAGYLADAEELWSTGTVQSKRNYPLSNWDNNVFDVALLLDNMSGDPSSEYRAALVEYLNLYINADGSSGIEASPLGLRIFTDLTWASLRLATFSSHTAMMVASFPGVDDDFKMQCFCLARSQLGYALGDTGRSYVVGVGEDFPTQPHHRDSACTLAEDADGLCDRKATDDKTYLFVVDRPNPHTLTGALVGGPDVDDDFSDDRSEFHFTEVALDYNAGLTLAAAGLASAPAAWWDVDCSGLIPNYPWADAAPPRA